MPTTPREQQHVPAVIHPPQHAPAPYMPGPVAPAPHSEVRIAGYREYGGIPVPVYVVEQPAQATPPRDLTPQPLLDRTAQRLIGGGALAAGAGWGAGELLGGIAAIPASSLVVLLAIVLALRARAGRTIVHQTTTVHQHAGLLGRNHNTTSH